MNKETIYREDAIKAINLKARIPHDVTSAHYADMAINAICSVPSADRQQREWIPCSERLPSESGRYLCTYAEIQRGEYISCVDFGSFINGEWYTSGVIAWMTLPKPWKGADDGSVGIYTD